MKDFKPFLIAAFIWLLILTFAVVLVYRDHNYALAFLQSEIERQAWQQEALKLRQEKQALIQQVRKLRQPQESQEKLEDKKGK